MAERNANIELFADGSVVVDLSTHRPKAPSQESTGFDENLAEVLDPATLQSISAELIEGIDADLASRQEWIENYNEGLKLLGILLEKQAVDSKTSRVRHPLLLWTIVKFQAQSRGELLPVRGPAKVENTEEPILPQEAAQALEDDTNFFYTTTASEYYPDTDRGLFYLGYGGTIFKKIYKCPIRKRPVSECVYLQDLIISNDSTDIPNASRVTHQVTATKQQVRTWQEIGHFRDVPLMSPMPNPDRTKIAMGQAIGVRVQQARPEDVPYTLYESYCLLDLGRFNSGAYREKDQAEGIALPYRVTLDRDSRQVLEVRRNWRQGDEMHMARRRFVKWGLVPGIGYLDLGFLNMLGNFAISSTALLRILIDSGIYAIWPGGLRVKGMRSETNEMRPGVGEFVEIDTAGLPISEAVMKLPFTGDNGSVLNLLQHVEELSEKTAGQIEVPTGTGLSNVPVGTMIAAIDQQADPEIAVHQRLHGAQKEELQLMNELFAEDEESFNVLTRGRKRPYTREMLARGQIIPRSDPNTPARIHRVMQATVLEQLSTAHPDLYNQKEVQKGLLEIAKIGNPDRYILPDMPPQPPPPDPTMAIAQLQAEIERERMQLEDHQAEKKLELDRELAFIKARLEKAKADQAAAAKGRELDIKEQEAQAKVEVSAQDNTTGRHLDAMASERELQFRASEADKDRESRELIAAMNDQTTLIAKGMEQEGEEKADNPARDNKAGP